MIIIWAKKGTMPTGFLRVKYKRKLPQVGDRIEVKPGDSLDRWQFCIVDAVKDISGQKLYYLSLA